MKPDEGQSPVKSKSSLRKTQSLSDEIIVSWLQMVRPYNRSELAKSIFHGYFNLCYVMSIFFILVYPLRKFIIKGIFCQEEVLKLFETNFNWDCISLAVFTVLGIIMMMLPQSLVKPLPVQGVLMMLYLGTGQLIISTNKMYYSDRAFVVFMCWGFASKIYSYFNSTTRGASLKEKLTFFFSPCLVFDGFAQGRLPKRRIIIRYVVKKVVLIFVCLFVNCIIIVEFIDPVLANKDKMSFLELFFNLIPPVFYINLTMIYTIFENVFSPLAEVTKMQNRRFFDDWWNSTNFHELLAKFNLNTDKFIQHHTRQLLQQWPSLKVYTHKIKIAVYLLTADLIAMQIFQKRITLYSLAIFLPFNIFLILFGGSENRFLNNYIVHSMFICLFPLLIALQVKFQLFSR